MEWASKVDVGLLLGAMVLVGVVAFRQFALRNATDAAPVHLGVQELVRQLSTELQALDEERTRANPDSTGLLRFAGAEIEVSFVAKASTSSRGTAELRVVTVEGGAEYSHEQVQKLTLKLLPIERTGSSPPLQTEPVKVKGGH